MTDLERAAQVCDVESNRFDMPGDYRYGAGMCAMRIRELSPAQADGETAPLKQVYDDRSLCGFCKTWVSRPCSEGCYWQPHLRPYKTRFQNVSCSQCGQSFGPGDHGFSHCQNHKGMRIAAERPAEVAAQTQEDELPGMLAVAKGVSEQTFPHTMDAKVWADEFVKWNSSADHGTMLGWFANAIMAGYDTAQQRAAPNTAAGSGGQGIATTDSHESPADERCQSAVSVLPDPKYYDNDGYRCEPGVQPCFVLAVDYVILLQHAARLQGELEIQDDANEILTKRLAEAERTVEQLREALRYWIPKTEPLQDQTDKPSTAHRNRWWNDTAALAGRSKT